MANSWMPGATVYKVAWAQNISRLGTKPKLFVMHVADSNATGPQLGAYFARVKTACSHFFVETDGTIYQYAPVSAKSGADYGVRYTVSVETQGLGAGKWTNAQMKSLAKIAVWLHDEWGIPLKAAETSDESGIGTHRLGCDGNFPSSGVQRGRLQRRPLATKLSGVNGKICPGYDRQAQGPEVVVMAQALDAGNEPTPSPKPVPVPKPAGDAVSVDGKWGSDTTKAYQVLRNLKFKDGKVSRQNAYWKSENPGLTTGWEWYKSKGSYGPGSPMIEDLQAVIGMPKGQRDGLVGPTTFKYLQKFLKKQGYYTGNIDGKIDKPSRTVKGFQRWINDQSKKKGK